MVETLVVPYFLFGFGRVSLLMRRDATVLTAFRYMGHVTVLVSVNPCLAATDTEERVFYITTVGGGVVAPDGTTMEFVGVAETTGPEGAPSAVVFVEVAN